MKQTILLLMLAGSIISCQNQAGQNQAVLTQEVKEKIKTEISNAVDNYNKAVTSNDMGKMLASWSDSEEFLQAGDGMVVGGYETWISWLRDWYDPDRKWLYWNGSNVNIAVLSSQNAVYTCSFEDAYVDGTDTTHVEGAWTFVFRKERNDWKVIASNGAHKGISY